MRVRNVAAATAAIVGLTITGTTTAGAASDAGGSPTQGGAARGRYQALQILAFNDFHGSLEAPTGSTGRVVTGHALNAAGTAAVDTTVDAGGAAYLAAHLAALRAGHKRSFTVTAGDTIGATPLLSAAFHDEPTIEATNLMGVDVASVGNHEFDEGYKELIRMAVGGCIDDGAGANNQNSCADHTYTGADYPYLSANVFYAGTTKTILPAYAVVKKDGVKVGFIGVTLKDTANIVTKSGIVGIEFGDEVTAVNKAAAALRRQGVETIITLIHQGAVPARQTWKGPDGKSYSVNPTYDAACQNGGDLTADSAIIPIAKAITPAVDAIVSAHTHQPYICEIPDPANHPRLVTSALANGRLVTELTLQYDPKTKDIVPGLSTAQQHIVSRDVTGSAKIGDLISTYKTLVAPIASKVLGKITADLTRTQSAGGESTLGDLIADAQVADPSVVTGGKIPVVAFMNPGGIRTDLTFLSSPNGEGNGVVTYEEAFSVQPFNNYLVSLDLTGAQIHALLEQQWSNANSGSAIKMLQISKGLSYSWRVTPTGRQVVPGSVKIGGNVVANDGSTTYRVVTNNFLADGGDNFPAFKDGANRFFGGLDIDGFAAFMKSYLDTPYAPQPLDRITVAAS